MDRYLKAYDEVEKPISKVAWLANMQVGRVAIWLVYCVVFTLCLTVQHRKAFAQDSEDPIPSMFKRAEQAREAYGEYSYEYRAVLYEIIGKIQNNPKNRQEMRRVLTLLLLNLWPEAHISADLEVLVVLGTLEFQDGDCENALRHLRRAKNSIMHLQSDPNAAQKWPRTAELNEVRYGIARCSFDLGQIEQSRKEFEGIIDDLRKNPHTKRVALPLVLHNLAALHWSQGNAAAAFPLLLESVRLTMANTEATKDILADRLRSLLLISVRLDSSEDLTWALSEFEKNNVPYLTPSEYVGVVYEVSNKMLKEQKYDDAEALLKRTKSSLSAMTEEVSGSKLYIEVLLAELGARRGSRVAFEKDMVDIERRSRLLPEAEKLVFAMRAITGGVEAISPILDSYFGKGGNAFDTHDWATRVKRVTTLGQSLLPDGHPAQRFAQLMVGLLKMETLDSQGATLDFQNILSEPVGFPVSDNEFRGFSMTMLSISLALEGRTDEAIFWSKAAFKMAAEQQSGAVVPVDQSLPFGTVDPGFIRDFNVRINYEILTKMLVQQGRLVEAQEVLQMLREKELTESLRSADVSFGNSQATLTGLEKKAYSRFYQLREDQAKLSSERLALFNQYKDGKLTLDGMLRLKTIEETIAPELRRTMSQFMSTVQKDMAASADKQVLQNSNNLNAEALQIQRVVDWLANEEPKAKAVGIQYLVGKDTLTIIVTVPGLPPIGRQLAVSRRDVYEAIQMAKTLLSTERSSPDRYKPALQALYKLFIAPIEGDLRHANARTLMLSLDDRVRLVPFAALVAPNGRYLVEDFALTLYNEASNRALFKAGAPKWRVAAMGLSEGVGALEPLQSVPSELADVVKAANGGGQTYLNDQFTMANLEQALAPKTGAAFNILHVASHFVLSPGQPAASSLYMGKGASISLAEMARKQLNFTGFDLVAYSACQSGVGSGRMVDGMEMESLSALTQKQGARAVLGTLWKVSDASVAMAMEMFYVKRGRSGVNLAEALRQAQLSLLQTPSAGDARFRHPFHWAAFVLAGNWR
jgi:CHAT domain-containing protein